MGVWVGLDCVVLLTVWNCTIDCTVPEVQGTCRRRRRGAGTFDVVEVRPSLSYVLKFALIVVINAGNKNERRSIHSLLWGYTTVVCCSESGSRLLFSSRPVWAIIQYHGVIDRSTTTTTIVSWCLRRSRPTVKKSTRLYTTNLTWRDAKASYQCVCENRRRERFPDFPRLRFSRLA